MTRPDLDAIRGRLEEAEAVATVIRRLHGGEESALVADLRALLDYATRMEAREALADALCREIRVLRRCAGWACADCPDDCTVARYRAAMEE